MGNCTPFACGATVGEKEPGPVGTMSHEMNDGLFFSIFKGFYFLAMPCRSPFSVVNISW